MIRNNPSWSVSLRPLRPLPSFRPERSGAPALGLARACRKDRGGACPERSRRGGIYPACSRRRSAVHTVDSRRRPDFSASPRIVSGASVEMTASVGRGRLYSRYVPSGQYRQQIWHVKGFFIVGSGPDSGVRRRLRQAPPEGSGRTGGSGFRPPPAPPRTPIRGPDPVEGAAGRSPAGRLLPQALPPGSQSGTRLFLSAAGAPRDAEYRDGIRFAKPRLILRGAGSYCEPMDACSELAEGPVLSLSKEARPPPRFHKSFLPENRAT